MFIVDDDRKYVVNVDNVIRIKLAGNEVQAFVKGELMPYPIGKYKSDERASEVFKELLESVFQPLEEYDIVVKNTVGASSQDVSEAMTATALISMNATYYMPEE